MSLFATNFRKQVTEWLAPVLRGSSHIDWLYSLVYPLETALTIDSTFETSVLDNIRYNGQKMVLQGGLNEIFGIAVAPFILIETRQTFNGLPALVLDQVEIGETSIVLDNTEGDTMLILDESEETPFDEDFVVKIPIGIYTPALEAQVDSQVIKYKVAGTTYRIETY